jgi:hypothetical protein
VRTRQFEVKEEKMVCVPLASTSKVALFSIITVLLLFNPASAETTDKPQQIAYNFPSKQIFPLEPFNGSIESAINSRRVAAYQRASTYCIKTSDANRELSENQFESVYNKFSQCLSDFIRKSPLFGSQYRFKGATVTYIPKFRYKIVDLNLKRNEYLEHLKKIGAQYQVERTSLMQEHDELVSRCDKRKREYENLVFLNSNNIHSGLDDQQNFGWNAQQNFGWNAWQNSGWNNNINVDVFSDLSSQSLRQEIDKDELTLKKLADDLETINQSIQQNIINYNYVAGYEPSSLWKLQQKIPETLRLTSQIEGNIEIISDSSNSRGESEETRRSINIHIGDDRVKHFFKITSVKS